MILDLHDLYVRSTEIQGLGRVEFNGLCASLSGVMLERVLSLLFAAFPFTIHPHLLIGKKKDTLYLSPQNYISD